MESEEAVVVPLVASPAELGTEAMLRMVLNREALIISRSPVSTKAASTGLVAQNTGAFAKAIGQSTTPSLACISMFPNVIHDASTST